MYKYILCLVLLAQSVMADECCPYEMLTVCELVKDSQMIQAEGKPAICRLLGRAVDCTDESATPVQEVIFKGDVLTINVYHPQNLEWSQSIQRFIMQQGGLTVDENGAVQIPTFKPVVVEGLTIQDAKQKIKDDLRNEVKDIDVFLSFRVKRTGYVCLNGLVNNRFIPIEQKDKLFEILAKAQVRPDANLFASYISRNGSALNVDFHRLIKNGDMSQNIDVGAGDKIFIASPTDHGAFVVGEITTSRPLYGGMHVVRGVPLPQGFTSLKEALTITVGGQLNYVSKWVHVIRSNHDAPKIYCISWHELMREPNNNLLIIPDDLVYLSSRPIDHWKVFIDELEPTLACIAGIAIIKNK